MRVKRRPRIPRVPLALQPVQARVEPARDRVLGHRQLERRVAVVRGEVGRGRVERAGGFEFEHRVDDELFYLGVG